MSVRCWLVGHRWRIAYPGGIGGQRVAVCRRCRATVLQP